MNHRMKNRCLHCKFFHHDPDRVEQAFPGLKALSSAYSSVRADAGICSLHEVFLPPWSQCQDFQLK